MKTPTDRDVERLAKWLYRAAYKTRIDYDVVGSCWWNQARALLVKPPQVLRRAMKERKVRR